MRKVGSFIGDWWRLVVPYFKSEDWPFAIPLLIGAIILTFTGVGLEKLFNDWYGRFYDALQNKDEPTFWREIITFSWLAALFIINGMARAIVSPYLRLRWRRWLTGHYLAHWLDGQGYYRIELARSVDNADQRIAEDLRFLGEYTMQLFLGLLSAVATLITFLIILWDLSGPLSLSFIGLDVVIPGYMAVGRAALCHRRHVPRQSGRPAAHPAQLHEAALRGQFPLLAGARAGERRGHRTLQRRATRGGQSQPPLRRRLRQRLAGPVHPARSSPSTSRATARSRSSFPSWYRRRATSRAPSPSAS